MEETLSLEQRQTQVDIRRVIARLWSNKATTVEIARALGISESDVVLVVQELLALQVDEYALRMQDIVIQEYFDLGELEKLCWQRLRETGDRGWAAEIRAIKQRKAEMLGTDQPKKTHTVSEERTLVVVGWDGSTVLDAEDPEALQGSGEVWRDAYLDRAQKPVALLDIPYSEVPRTQEKLNKTPIKSGDPGLRRKEKKAKSEKKRKEYLRGYQAGRRDNAAGKEPRDLSGHQTGYRNGYRAGYGSGDGE